MRADPSSRIASSTAHRARLLVAVAIAVLLSGEVSDSRAQAYIPQSPSAKKPAELKERPPGLVGFGEHYDSAKYEECHKKDPRNSRCEIYRLKRKPAPEYWPYHDKSPMKWPDPPKEQVYRPGMGPVEYWRALCKAEAGEFIYRTVPNVEAIYQIRPRPKESSYSASDRYVREDPYGYIESESGTLDGIIWHAVGPGWTSRKSPGGYPLFESPPLENDILDARKKTFPAELFQQNLSGFPYQRFSGYVNRYKQMKLEYSKTLNAQYGWTWRGIKRPFDREIGVAGGELAVVDLRTGEIIGIRRGFLLGARTTGGPVGWGGGTACPEYFAMPGIGSIRHRSKDFDFSFWFLNKVLVPIGQYQD